MQKTFPPDSTVCIPAVYHHASTHYYLGRNYEALGQRQKAIEHYRIALELSQGKAPWAEDARERIRRL